MPERIYKLQPDRTLYLRGFDSFAAAASIHSATPTGFEISGVFRDPADFAVAVLYDADNLFEHPSIRYLPDFNFSGITLSFDLLYQDPVQPIDSPKYNWIDWATLDCIRPDGSTANIPLWDHSMLVDPVFPAASATLNVVTTGGIQPNNRLTLWYQNLAFDYSTPAGEPTLGLNFLSGATGTVHSITINARVYSHTEAAAETSADLASALAAAINVGDAEVAASASSNTVILTVLPAAAGKNIEVSATDGNQSTTMYAATPAGIAAQLASIINGTNWVSANTTHGLLATSNGAALTVTAARYGTVSVSGTSVTWISGTKFSGITPGSTILLGGTAFQVAAIQSPLQLTLTTAPPATAERAICRAARGPGRQHDPVVRARQLPRHSGFRSISDSAERRQFGSHLELFPRLHRAGDRSTPPVLAHIRAFAHRWFGIHARRVAGHVFQLAAHGPTKCIGPADRGARQHPDRREQRRLRLQRQLGRAGWLLLAILRECVKHRERFGDDHLHLPVHPQSLSRDFSLRRDHAESGQFQMGPGKRHPIQLRRSTASSTATGVLPAFDWTAMPKPCSTAG